MRSREAVLFPRKVSLAERLPRIIRRVFRDGADSLQNRGSAPWTRASNDEPPSQQAGRSLTTGLDGWIATIRQNGRSPAKLAHEYRQPADYVQSVVDTPLAVAED